MRFIPAPEITTTEGTLMLTVFESVLLFSCVVVLIIIFSFIIIMRFIPAPEITTTEGKSNVNSI